MIGEGFQPNPAAFGNQLISSAIELLVIVVVLWILRGIVRFIIRILKWILGLLFGRNRTADRLHSNDWLTRAQAKQEIRFQNASPPLLPKKQPQKKKWRPFQKKGLEEDVKDHKISETEATEKMNQVLNVAISAFYSEDSKSFEKALRNNKKDYKQLCALFSKVELK